MARFRNSSIFSSLIFPCFSGGFLFFAGSSPFTAAKQQEPVCLLPEEYDVWSCDWAKKQEGCFCQENSRVGRLKKSGSGYSSREPAVNRCTGREPDP